MTYKTLKISSAILAISSIFLTHFAFAQSTERIKEMEQVIDAADAKIREVRDQLSTPGLSTEAIFRLNQLLSDQQWAKAQAESVIVKERRRIDDERNRRNRIEIEISIYNRDMAKLNARSDALDDVYHALIAEAGDLGNAIARHNDNPNRTDARKRELDSWQADFISRWNQFRNKAINLDREFKELEKRRIRINSM